MILIFYLVNFIQSILIQPLPLSGTSPPRLIHSSPSSTDPKTLIYFFGGEEENNSHSSSLFSYDINQNYWQEIFSHSSFAPEGLSRCKSFFNSQNKLIVFFGVNEKGISENIYSFDVKLAYWQEASFSGDFIYPLIDSADCVFVYKSKTYFAIYGGVSINGLSSSLYL